MSLAAPLRKFKDEARARASLAALDVGPYTLEKLDLGRVPEPFWRATFTEEAKRQHEEKGGVVVHVGRGWMARLAWCGQPCIRCEVP